MSSPWAVILPPSSNDRLWRDRLAQVSATSGQNILVFDGARAALAAGMTGGVVIVPPLSEVYARCAELTSPTQTALTAASAVLAEAASLPEGWRLFGPEASGRENARVQLFNDLHLLSPGADPAAGTLDGDIEQALRLSLMGPRGLGDDRGALPIKLLTYDALAVRGSPAPGVMDITGKPRILAFGPYVWLPEGSWTATVRFSLDAEAARHEFRLDWGQVETFSSLAIHLRPPGLYEATLSFDWPRAASAELRLIVMEGAFDGVVSLSSVELVRKPLSRAHTAQ